MRRRRLGIAIALGVFSLIVISAHAYFAARLVRDTQLPEPWAGIARLAITLGALSIFAYPTADRVFGARVGRALVWPTMLWLGSCFYLLLAFSLSDLVLLAAGLHGLEVARIRALVVLGLAGCLVGLGVWSVSGVPRVKRVEISLAGWPLALDGYRILQISDIHIGPTLRRAFAERLVAGCNAVGADLIAITGDLVDGSVHFLRDEVLPFAELRARDGVYFVTGNHDHYSGGERWARRVAELGIEVLRNRRVAIERDGASFHLAGVEDWSTRRLDTSLGHDLDATLAGWDARTPLILLAHDPRTFDDAKRRGVHLQLSGHTHGGQLWPFTWLVRLQTSYIAGLYQRERSHLYVSRGTGYWGPPMRVFAPAEITDLCIRCQHT